MEQEKKREIFSIPLPDETPSVEPAQESAPKQKPMSLGGFAENTFNDAFDFLKAMYQIIPSSVKSYQENLPKILDPKSLEMLKRDPSLMWNAVKETGSGVAESIIEPYKKHGLRALYEKPLTVATDLATVLTLGGGAVAKTGRLAGGTLKGVGKASDLVRAGVALEQLPGKIARGVVDKTVLKASGGNWNLAKRRQFTTLKREEQARRLVKTEEDATRFGQIVGKMDDLEVAQLDKFIRLGANSADLAASPKAAEAFRVLKQMDAEVWRPYLTSSKFKSEAELERALAKKYAHEAWGDVSKAKVDEASEIIRKMREAEKLGDGLAPVYAPHIPEGKIKRLTSEDLMDDLVSGGRLQREGAVGQLEEFGGKSAKYVKDPRKYVPAAIHAFRDLEAKTRLSSRLLQEKALIKGGGEALTPETLFKNNPEGVYRKYYEDNIRSEALKSITDPTIQRLLRWEYITTRHGAIRLYDKIMSLFAKSATRWNPKWQTGNVIGDAVLGTLVGSDWRLGALARKSGNLPYEAVARGGAGAREGVESMMKAPRWVDNAFEIGENADKAARAGIIAKATARELESVGLKVEAFSQSFEDVMRSTRDFSDVQVALQQVEEEIARRSASVQRIDKILAKQMEREADMARKLEGLDLRRRTKSVEKNAKAQDRLITNPDGPTSDRGWVRAKTAEEAIPLGAAGSAAFEKGLDEINVVRQRIINLEAKRSAILRDITDDMVKKGALDAKIPDLRRQVEIVRPAVDRANAAIGDYLGLDGFEQRVMKRVIPFYSWAKAMTMLAFRVPYLAPVRSMLWNRMSQFMVKMTEDPDLPEYMKGRVPIFALKDGRQVWVNLSSFSPFGGLNQSRVGGVPVPGMLNVVERNPMIALGFGYMGGKTVWNASAVPFGEPMVNMHDGTVVEFTNDGMLKKVIPQTPLVSGAVHFFPTVQLAEQILTPYWTNKHNWAGLPEPIMNPDGSYRYPKELWDRLSAAVGVNLMTRSAEDLKRGERRKVYNALNELKGMHNRSTDAEEREMLKEIMRDYVNENKYRKFK